MSLITKGVKKTTKRTPGGNLKTYYSRTQRPSKRKCENCGAELHGTMRLKPSRVKNLSKSQKKANRPYSNLCSKCMRKLMIKKAESYK